MVIPAGRVLTRRLLFTAKPQSAPLCRLHVLHRSSRLNCPLSTAFGGVRFAVTKAKAGTKTAAKKPAKKPAAKKSAAKKPAAKKPAAKKPAAKKKTTAKKGATKKPVKKKPVKKKAVKKPVKKKPKKVVLTPEQKKRREMRELRVKALDAPGISPASGWIAYISEKKSISPEVSKEWAALPAEEKQVCIPPPLIANCFAIAVISMIYAPP